MSDTICLDHRGDYYCILDKHHRGPHMAHQNHPEQHPGCVWEDEEVDCDA
jgi:hypothetical protein